MIGSDHRTINHGRLFKDWVGSRDDKFQLPVGILKGEVPLQRCSTQYRIKAANIVWGESSGDVTIQVAAEITGASQEESPFPFL